MKNNDWYDRDDENDFGEALHRRTEELYNVPDASPDEEGLIECPVLPLRDLVIFPHMVSPIFLSQEASILAVEEAQLNDSTVIALTQRDPDVDDPSPQDFFPIGVELAVGRMLSMPDGSSSALVQGRRRVEVVEFTQLEPYLVVRARPVYSENEVDRETARDEVKSQAAEDLIDITIAPQAAHKHSPHDTPEKACKDQVFRAWSQNH